MKSHRRTHKVLRAGVVTLGILLGTYRDDVSAADTSAPAKALSAAAGATNLDWSSAQLVAVRLVDDRFIPEKFSFRHGVPYHLHLENNGTTMHEFTAPEFFKAIYVKNLDVMEAEHNELLLQPKEQKDLYFVAPNPGHYSLTCADHDWDGMTGDITVE
jgi:uncharacterized cupredoxin-like copper-binding protein